MKPFGPPTDTLTLTRLPVSSNGHVSPLLYASVSMQCVQVNSILDGLAVMIQYGSVSGFGYFGSAQNRVAS